MEGDRFREHVCLTMEKCRNPQVGVWTGKSAQLSTVPCRESSTSPKTVFWHWALICLTKYALPLGPELTFDPELAHTKPVWCLGVTLPRAPCAELDQMSLHLLHCSALNYFLQGPDRSIVRLRLCLGGVHCQPLFQVKILGTQGLNFIFSFKILIVLCPCEYMILDHWFVCKQWAVSRQGYF